ncbi:MAG: hypothetical protein WCY05_01935 [Candidatus Omnitrophota bacterium]
MISFVIYVVCLVAVVVVYIAILKKVSAKYNERIKTLESDFKNIDNGLYGARKDLIVFNKWKTLRDCIDSGRHKPVLFIRAEKQSILPSIFSPAFYIYVFMCNNCREEYRLQESELSKEQRNVLVAMGILKK